MKSQFLETGQIVNTHGVKGEVKVVPWADSPEYLRQFHTFYLEGGTPLRALSVRVDKTNVLIRFEGVDTVEISTQGYQASYRSHQLLDPQEAVLRDELAETAPENT